MVARILEIAPMRKTVMLDNTFPSLDSVFFSH